MLRIKHITNVTFIKSVEKYEKPMREGNGNKPRGLL